MSDPNRPVTDDELDQFIADRERERAEARRAYDRTRAASKRQQRREHETREMKRHARDVEDLRDTPHGAVPPFFWNK